MNKLIKQKFVIYTPSFDENSGGVIALHKLCDALNYLGEKAYITNYYFIRFNIKKPFRCIYYFLRYIKNKGFNFKTNTLFNTPIIKHFDVDDQCIVIYPEIVSGNPLKAKNVIRWFLHMPGFHTGTISYGKNELYFFYQEIFNNLSLNSNLSNLLNPIWLRDDIYKIYNFDKRYGSCYLLRKGKNRKIVHDLSNSILIDGMHHEQISEVMNKCEYFISYDTETMYSQYAVLCGCKSIVIPKNGISKNEWQPKKEFQFGIAYGFDDLEEANLTKDLVYPMLKKHELESINTVKLFIGKAYKFFN